MGNKAGKQKLPESNAGTQSIGMKYFITTKSGKNAWKPTVKYNEDRVSGIIESELAYYRSILTGKQGARRAVSVDFEQKGALEGILPVLIRYKNDDLDTIPDLYIDPKHKEEFIATRLPKMVEEYQLFMLNLAAKLQSKQIEDTQALNQLLSSFVLLPVSVQLLWRCHILHPYLYYKDCMKHFGFLLSPQINGKQWLNKNAITRCSERNKFIFLEKYRNPSTDELHHSGPQYEKWKASWSSDIVCDAENKFTDLDFSITAMKQLEFMSKVGCTVWRNNLRDHLDKYITKYVRYLQTGAKMLTEPEKFRKSVGFDGLSPTFNIDLIWHIHMMYPCLYRNDCRTITNGIILDHDDLSIGDHGIENDEQNEEDSYWKFGRLGQFNNTHFVRVMIGGKYELLVHGFIHNKCYKQSERSVPNDVVQVIFESYFDAQSVARKELSPEPPQTIFEEASCKYGPACCVGNHINFGRERSDS